MVTRKITKTLSLTPSPGASPIQATTITSSVPSFIAKYNTSALSIDDSTVDYTSMLGMEDRRKRFSEEVVDTDLKDSVRLQKLYRQIQRQVHCREKVAVSRVYFVTTKHNEMQVGFLG